MSRKMNRITQLICERCGAVYELRRAPNKGRPKLCGECLRIDRNTRARKANYHGRLGYKEKAREWRLNKYYNISTEEYNKILDRQNGKCAICKLANTGDCGQPLAVDHCHNTNTIRGLLCDKCNRAIGTFEDDIVKLQNAILYLIRTNQDRSWDRYFINIAALVSTRSKDPSTQVGAILVKEGVIIATGYNGFPRNFDDSRQERYNRPAKYSFTVHAEENAILNSARQGISTINSTIYITPIRPCHKCMRAIIQCGIKRVVCQSLISDEKWEKDFKITKEMIEESGIEYVEIP